MQKIIIAMKNLNIEVNFPASHLKQPFGEAVVSVIDLLSDKALSKVGFIFLKPIHTNDELTERNQVHDVFLLYYANASINIFSYVIENL